MQQLSILGILSPEVLIIIGIVIYIIPSILAQKKKNQLGIVLLNILLGWTVLGWIASLIWAATAPIDSQYEKGFEYICHKCGYKKKLDQEVKLFKCPQCGDEYDTTK
jgi:hypothetical protein